MINERKTVGDVAVDGLLSGVVAGVAAALYLVIIGLFSGETFHSILGRFDPQQTGNAILGIFVHLGMSAVYGGLFAVLYRPIRHRMPTSPVLNLVIGLIYGIILMLVAELVFNSGIESALDELSKIQFALFHIIFGLVLVVMIEKFNRPIVR
jgi:hypothetical protein